MEDIYKGCQQKQDKIKALFAACSTDDAKYQKIIELGKSQKGLDAQHKISENIVSGCQSVMYLHSSKEEGKVYFSAASDALISAGLAALLTQVYSGELPEVILKHPPTYIEELGISASLTPNRANGLYSVHLRMKQDALKLLMQK